jgi:hypothetical protein
MAALIDRFMDDEEKEAPKTESLEVEELDASADEEELGDAGGYPQ